MNAKLINKLLLISAIGLGVAGIIFIVLQFITDNNWILVGALICVTISNLFNIIRINFNKSDK